MEAPACRTPNATLALDDPRPVTTTGVIPCRPPFDLALSLEFLCGFSPMAGEQTIDGAGLTKALMIDGRPVGVRVGGDDGTAGLRYALTAASPIDRATEERAVRRLASFLSAGEDLAPFYALTEADPVMAPIGRRLRGLHHVKFPSPFEAACWGVINQRIGMAHARAMKEALVRHAGAAVAIDGRVHWAFPEAASVAALGEAGLTSLLGSERKARSVHAVSLAFERVGDAFFEQASHGQIKAWLEAIHGVGPFTTGFVLYRGLGRFEHPPISPRFTRAAESVYGRRLDEPDLLRLAAHYGRWGGHWALYLWASTFVACASPRASAPVSWPPRTA